MALKIYYKKDAKTPIRDERMLSVYFKTGEANLSARAIKELSADRNVRVVLASDEKAWYMALVDNESGYKLTRKSKALGFRARIIFRKMSKFYKTEETLRLLISKEPIHKDGLDFYQLMPID